VSVLRLTIVVLALVALGVLAVVGVEAWDRPESAVEAGVRRYAIAVSSSDLDGAMAEIAPEQRPRWKAWVQSQLGNVYDVTGIAVRAPWLLARPTDVTVDIDINREFEDEFYQATPRVALEEVDGRWYLAAPLLAPTSEL
jgi:hypothetical protein